MDEPDGDIETHLANLETKERDLNERCYFVSSYRVASEIRRTARAENRLTPYLHATFTQLNHADSLLQPEAAQKAAIEMIGLLESEDRARMIQPDFPESEHSHAVHWYSSCAYDNLAKATALLKGYNSDGMHACIADGMQVCRRTGKMQCVTCFREYATDVYRSADDLEMAMHFARAGVAHDKPGPHDRRWVGARDLTRLRLLQGEIHAAAEMVEIAWSLTETWHNPLHGRLDTKLLMQEIALLLGEPSRWDERFSSEIPVDAYPPAGEYPWFEWRKDVVEAISHCCTGTPERAVQLLTVWDRKLTQSQCLHDWLDNQLRLLAAHRMAGDQSAFTQAASRLEARAKEARDWLTLRCLEYLRNTTTNVAPVPVVNGIVRSKDASTGTIASADAVSSQATASESSANQDLDKSAPPEFIMALWQRMRTHALDSQDGSAESNDSLQSILADLMAVDAATARPVEDARWMLHTASFMIVDDCPKTELWAWAEQVAQPYLRDAATLNLLAKLGFSLQVDEEPGTPALVDLDQIEQMFRESLELDSNRHRNFARAADFFLYQENIGEAERCLARGLRLQRSDGELAIKLAKIYRRTERDRDALAVLDLCLREGCDDPDVLWEAGLTAYQAESYEAAVTYFDAYEKQQPDRPWVQYYRAASLLELQRFEEALAAADEEANRSPESSFANAVFRATATAGLDESNRALAHIEEVLNLRLSEIDNLTPQGINKLFSLLWNITSQMLANHADVRKRLEDRMIASGLSPNELFTAERDIRDVVENLNYYVCTLHQPLDERWTNWHGRLEHEADWTSYDVPWGVLATSEDEAREVALMWQERAFPLAATVQEVQLQDDGYRDKPGVIWQGYRFTDE